MNNTKKILMIVAPKDYRDEEFEHPKEILKQNGYQITVSSKDTETAYGALGGWTSVGIDISKVDAKDYDASLFIGGPGANIYFKDPTAHKIVNDAYASDKVIGAICIAPSILANAGILKNKKATAFPSEKDNLEKAGAQFTGEKVTVDGKIVTASGPDAAKEFGKEIVRLLS